jgi:chitinase
MKPESVKLINAAVIAVILFSLALWPSALLAVQVTLEWDANQPAPDGYRLYQSNDAHSFDYSSAVWSGKSN